MLQALQTAEVDELGLDDRARRELTTLDSWNEDAARRIADRLQETGEGAIQNKSGYVMTSVKKINAASELDTSLEGAEQGAKLTDGQEEYSEEEEEEEEYQQRPWRDENEPDQGAHEATEEYQEEDWYEDDYGEHYAEEEPADEEYEESWPDEG